MASPFSIFRKNQRLMFALLTVLVMIGFVFLPIFMQTSGVGGRENPVVVNTKYGKLTEQDLAMMRQKRRQVQAVLVAAMESVGFPPDAVQRMLEAQLGPATEDAVVTTWVTGRYAEEMGIVVSKDAINGFLKELTQDRVKAANFNAALKRIGMSGSSFFDAMRDELAAQELNIIFRTSLSGVTPAQRWDYFNRIKRQAIVELAPVPVESMLDKIDDPTDAELTAFFEEHKNSLQQPDSSTPGFREPQRVALEWFQADVEKLASSASVTDAEVKERYEKNRDLYEPPAKKPEAKAPAENGETKKEAPEAKEPSEAKAPEATAEPAKEAAPEAAAPPADEKSEKKEEAPAQKPADTSSVPDASPFKLVAMLQEKPAEAAPAAEAKPADAPAAAAPETKPAETAPAAPEKPAEQKPEMAEATKNRIRREIAYERTAKVFEGLREQLEKYRRDWNKYELLSKKKEGVAPPARPDFAKLASENGLTTGSMDLCSQWEMRSSDIGGAWVNRRSPLWAHVFQATAKFRPEPAQDLKGDLFLFWVTDETKDRVPEFKDEGVRERVLREWKMVQARKLAFDKASAMAAEAQRSGKPLRTVFADAQVFAPPAFSWLTFGNIAPGYSPTSVRISDVQGVTSPGEAFMRAVFQLEPGQVGAALNAPMTTAYVIRLLEFAPSQDVLMKQFEVDDFSKYAAAAQHDGNQMMMAWREEICKAAGVKWLRKADSRAADAPAREQPQQDEEY